MNKRSINYSFLAGIILLVAPIVGSEFITTFVNDHIWKL